MRVEKLFQYGSTLWYASGKQKLFQRILNYAFFFFFSNFPRPCQCTQLSASAIDITVKYKSFHAWILWRMLFFA